ncbi:bacterial regulatory, lacI family protein [Brucella thiophenivorans]|uniref:Bacterial regulatory, lacI family protein n=2 Tax=Brucella thiophenivorans TaxID=571255 RepID=A0A256FWZ2_9HYPH|nr:bacterial regulatory, lacI family protein [Brucella thiophenivorans]
MRLPDPGDGLGKDAAIAVLLFCRVLLSLTGEKALPRKSRRKGSGVTMADVAAAAGVSMQTVSRTLRYPDTVTPEKRKIIQDAIEKTHYVHNLAASHLASHKSNTVAAIIPTLSASVFADTIQHFSDVLHRAGYQIFLGNTDYSQEREEEIIRSLLGRRPDGIFLIGTQHTKGSIALLKRAEIPIVESWDMTDRPLDRLVGFSNANAIGNMVDHLLETGKRHIVFAGVVRKGDNRAAERRAAFEAKMANSFSDQKPRMTIATDMPLVMTSGVDLLALVRAQYPEADAIMFSSDILASGALLETQRRGINVPEQLAITGFGDFELSQHLVPPLTTVAVPSARIGRQAAKLLLEGMRGEVSVQNIVDVGFELKIRASG